jgi:hypothetical protein
MKIEVATDWQEVHSELRGQLRKLGYNPDLQKMLNNITDMVVNLSKVEVDARRSKSDWSANEHLLKINQAIDHLEKLLLMAMLMR